MAMTERDDDAALEALFAAARNRAPEPSADLLARVLAQAEAVQAEQVARRPKAPAARRGGAWRGLLDLIGGWGGVGGLAAAGVTGLWIGFTGTGAIGTATVAIWGEPAAEIEAFLDSENVISMMLVSEEGT